MSNLYIENKFTINPAYAGINVKPQFYLSYKKVAASINGTPELLSFGASAELYKSMSLGARFYKQSEGLFNTIIAFADYSYKLNLNNEHMLRFGVSAGLNSNKIDYSNIIADDPSAIIDVASRDFEGISFESAAGFAYQWKRLEWSVAIPKLFDSKNNIGLMVNSLLQYNFKLQAKEIDIRPGLFVIYKKNNPWLYDINLQAFWKNKFWLGFGYRNRPGIIISAGLNMSNIGISYATELGTEKYANMFNQVHEVSISYAFKKRTQTPNDTLISPLPNLVAKTDSIDNDSINAINQHNNLFALTDQTNDSSANSTKNPNLENIVENRSESIDIQPLQIEFDSSKNEQLFYEDDFIDENSSVIPKKVKPVKQGPKEIKFKLVETGEGVFTLKSNITSNDSIQNEEFDEAMLDSLLKQEDIFNEQNSVDNPSNNNHQSIYYTIKLFINASNNYLLTDAEIADKARVEQDKDGEINYYYGYFNTPEEAKKYEEKFSKYSDLKVELVELKAFR